MATFEQNLAKIRGEAIYGSDMRTAIADAIEQADDQVQEDVVVYKQSVDQVIQGVDDRVNTMRTIIDDHLFYISVEQIGETNDFVMSITEGEQ